MGNLTLSTESSKYEESVRWTTDSCRQLEELGFLNEKYELINGEVITKMGQKPQHRIAILYFIKWLTSFLNVLQVQSEAPISISKADRKFNGPEPDIAVTRKPTDFYRDRHPGGEDILFVAEVSDSSLNSDLTIKSMLYARAGIPEYWALDITGGKLYVHTLPEAGMYTKVHTYQDQDDVALTEYPEAPIRVSALLP